MINWSTLKISSPDILWQVSLKLNRPDCRTAREIVLSYRANKQLELERLLRD